MAALAASGRVRTLDEALDLLAAPQPPPVDPVVVTFDDGTADFADVAMPILERHGVPATLYVATDFVDRGRSFPDDGTPLSWAALRDAAAGGLVTVGSHTHTHALLDRLPAAQVAAELDRACDLIADNVGAPPAHFAYPKAVAGSPAADAEVRARHRSAAVAGTRPNRFGATDPYRLARSPIQVADGMTFFHAKAAGGMRLEDDLRTAANRWRYRKLAG
jgi:peptidoglycan/xylan/chitin deacetylase (PgdA/CDA1 family)